MRTLSEFKGRPVLVYFYPRADTPGCTTQACGLRDVADEVGDAAIIGISPDKPAAQKRFDTKYSLGFPLLSDPDHAVAEAFDVWREKKMYGRTSMGILRSAFLIDGKGKVQEAWYKISPKDTPTNLLAALAGVTRMTGSGFPEPAAVLPHRPPFLFVDEVVELVPGERVVARWHLTGDEWFFSGHFPGRPTLPGVLMCEAIAQAGALAVLLDDRYAGKLPLFGGLDGARFRRQVGPGDTLTLEVEFGRLSARAGKGSGRARLGDQVACECDLMFVLVDA